MTHSIQKRHIASSYLPTEADAEHPSDSCEQDTAQYLWPIQDDRNKLWGRICLPNGSTVNLEKNVSYEVRATGSMHVGVTPVKKDIGG